MVCLLPMRGIDFYMVFICAASYLTEQTGHTTSKEVTRYTRGARQKVLAAKAMARFDQNKN